jgi:hypothetical protein
MKNVDHWNGAEDGIEIKDGGAPLAIYYVPGDADALYRWEESGENRPYPGGSLNGRANRSYKLNIVVKWRTTYIPGSKPVQVRFNGVDHVFPHEKLHFQVVPQIPSPKGGGSSPILQDPVRLYDWRTISVSRPATSAGVPSSPARYDQY